MPSATELLSAVPAAPIILRSATGAVRSFIYGPSDAEMGGALIYAVNSVMQSGESLTLSGMQANIGTTGLSFPPGVSIRGASMSSPYPSPTYGTRILYSGTTGYAMTFAGQAAVEQLSLINTSFGTTNPTSGGGITISNGVGTLFRDLFVGGFYTGISVITGTSYFAIDRCFFGSAINAGLYVEDTAIPDDGDFTVDRCVFGSFFGSGPNGAYAFLWNSGSGIKFSNNKINSTWGYGVFCNTSAGISDIQITANSIENCTTYGVYISSSSRIANHTVTGNEFGESGAGVYIGNVQNFNVQGNVFDSITNSSIYLDGCVAGVVGANSHTGVGCPVTANSVGGSGVEIYPQVLNGTGVLAADNTPTNFDGYFANFRHDHFANAQTGGSSTQTIFTIALLDYLGGMIEVDVDGLCNGGTTGTYATNKWAWSYGNSGNATITAIGPAAHDTYVAIALDNSTAGQIKVTLTNSASGQFFGHMKLRISGNVQSVTRNV